MKTETEFYVDVKGKVFKECQHSNESFPCEKCKQEIWEHIMFENSVSGLNVKTISIKERNEL